MQPAYQPPLPRVVLVHGLFLGRLVMIPLARRLQRAGFDVKFFGYNTITGSLAASADKLAQHVKRVAGASQIALVGHSLGGLVSVQAAQGLPKGLLVAIVMIGSPYAGSKAGAVLRSVLRGPWIGRALHDWGGLQQRPKSPVPVYTLAGTNAVGLGLMLCEFDAPNDGTVAVSETHYPGAVSCVLPVSHTGMLFNANVAQQIATWLVNCIKPTR